MTTEHIVIEQRIVTVGEEDWKTNYLFDGQRFATRQGAIGHGFDLAVFDDFNVATLTDGRLTWFGWMDDELDDYDLAEIAKQIGVKA